MRISHCRPPGSDRDVVLMCGVEPNMRWRTFCDELLAVIDKLNVDTVVILGALLADTPHTRPVPVSGAAYSAASARQFGLQETRYEGPTGIAGVFQSACVGAGIPAVTFWAAVPHYVSHPPNPKATIALLRRVEDVLDVEVPLADLPAQAEAWEREITEDDRRRSRAGRVRADAGTARRRRGGHERGSRQHRRRRAGRRVRALSAPAPPGVRALEGGCAAADDGVSRAAQDRRNHPECPERRLCRDSCLSTYHRRHQPRRAHRRRRRPRPRRRCPWRRGRPSGH